LVLWNSPPPILKKLIGISPPAGKVNERPVPAPAKEVGVYADPTLPPCASRP
jgi:hypothetical protein